MGCKTSRGDFFYLLRVSFPSSLNGPQADPLLSFFLFACRMAKGYEEVSSSQVGRQRGTPGETPTVSSLVPAMSIEELRLYSQVLAEISLEVSDDVATLAVGEADNTIYFTREQFATGIHFPVPSLVK